MVPKPQSLGRTGTAAQARPAPAVLFLVPLGGEAEQVAAMAASAGRTGTPVGSGAAKRAASPETAGRSGPKLRPGPARQASLAKSSDDPHDTAASAGPQTPDGH